MITNSRSKYHKGKLPQLNGDFLCSLIIIIQFLEVRGWEELITKTDSQKLGQNVSVGDFCP